MPAPLGPPRRPARLPSPLALAVALAAACPLAGCITERTGYKPRGVPVEPGQGPADLDISSALAPPSNPAVSIGRARFGVAPLGAIRYDGITLPVFAPSGEFLATQVTDPPTWAALLALPGEGRADLSRVQVVRLTADAAVPVEFPGELTRGLLLGRSASDTGVLVESPQPDGSRWIGRLAWTTGQVDWLVREAGIVAAHALELRDGTLVYCRRAVDDIPFSLVIATPGKPNLVVPAPSECALYPLASPSQRYVGFMAIRFNRDKIPPKTPPALGRGSEWGAMDLVSVDLRASGGPAIAGRFRVADAGSPKQAFQAAAGQDASPADLPVTPVPPAAATPDPRPRLAEPRDTYALVATRWEGVALLGAATGNVVRLAPKAVAATLVPMPSGVAALVSTDRDLLYIEDPTRAPARTGTMPPSARVTTQPLIVRGSAAESSPQSGGVSGRGSLFGLGLDPMGAEHTLRLLRLTPVVGP